MLAKYLTEKQIAKARRMWDEEGKTLGEIAAALGKDKNGITIGTSHLSPWLPAEMWEKVK